jgi:hexosaminidase
VDGTTNTTSGVLDPAKNETFKVIEALLADYYDGKSGVFTDGLVHLGADEVPTDCWDNAFDNAFIQKMGLNTTAGLFSYFVQRVHDIAAKVGRRPIMWDEAYTKGASLPPKGTIIQMWNAWARPSWPDAPPGPNKLLQQIVRAGYDTIASPDVPWYLNVVQPHDATCNTQWQCIFAFDPTAGMTAEEAARVLGGEGCLWGETVDGSDVMSTLWPRLGAIAERLWSPTVSDLHTAVKAMEPRLRTFRCLLLQRGFGAGPVGDAVGDPSVAPFARLHGPPGPGGCAQDSSPIP